MPHVHSGILCSRVQWNEARLHHLIGKMEQLPLDGLMGIQGWLMSPVFSAPFSLWVDRQYRLIPLLPAGHEDSGIPDPLYEAVPLLQQHPLQIATDTVHFCWGKTPSQLNSLPSQTSAPTRQNYRH